MSPETVLTIVRGLVDLILLLVPAPVAHQIVDDAAIRRAHAIADAAEASKFGPTDTEDP